MENLILSYCSVGRNYQIVNIPFETLSQFFFIVDCSVRNNASFLYSRLCFSHTAFVSFLFSFFEADLILIFFMFPGMAQSQGWVKRYFKAFCKGFFVAVPVAVTVLDRVACVARVEGASMQVKMERSAFFRAQASLVLKQQKQGPLVIISVLGTDKS